MNMEAQPVQRGRRRFVTDAARWRAVMERDAAAVGAFVYSVRTTGVYCRPTCPSRRALRKNIVFHDSPQAAKAAGYRPCRRCRPDAPVSAARHSDLVAKVCRMIENVDTPPNLDELASAVGLSQFQLHRIFKLALGVTPRQYAVAGRNRRIRGRLAGGQSVTRAIYGAGFNSSSRFYAESASILGMIPAAFRAGGANTTIRFAVGHCWLGEILVAATPTGVCAILLGDDPEKLVQELVDLFPAAELVGDDSCFAGWMAQIVAFVAEPRIGLNLPLDIQGTAFQHRVWDALRRIPPGTVLTYTELARRIGRPRAVRAVARACGANRLAVAIPCHRVVRTDGSPAGYRWGVERKQALIRREQRRGQDSPATIEGR